MASRRRRPPFKKTHSIRNAFEYQDLVASSYVLDVLFKKKEYEAISLDSDEVHYVDDIVVHGARKILAIQVKWHVTAETILSFDTLLGKPKAAAEPLLKKLFRGWDELTAKQQEKRVSVSLVTHGVLTTKADDIGTFLDAESARLRLPDEMQVSLADKIGVDLDRFREFLECFEVHLSIESMGRLRQNLQHQLAYADCPSHEDAVNTLVSAVGEWGANRSKQLRREDIARALREDHPIFADAMVKMFPSLFVPGAMKHTTDLRIALVQFCPASVGNGQPTCPARELLSCRHRLLDASV